MQLESARLAPTASELPCIFGTALCGITWSLYMCYVNRLGTTARPRSLCVCGFFLVVRFVVIFFCESTIVY